MTINPVAAANLSARTRFIPQMLLLLVQFIPAVIPSAGAAETVALQLKWAHAFQFAGYYAAKELGYYREAGLDVDIREALPAVDSVEEVVSGRAEFGVGTSSLLLARQAGKPVVVLAVIFQHSPYVLIARRWSSTQSIHDLAGRRIMMEPLSDELLAYLKREGIPLNSIQRVEHSFEPQDLIAGKTDAISAYVTNQPYYLKQVGFDYQVYTPRSAGIDFYGDNLFTSEQELKQHPERVKAFRAASLRGWQYAMEHSEEIIRLILNKYPQRHSREYYEFEAAEMVPLVRADLVPVGYMNLGRWRHIADTYADIGMLPRKFSLAGFLYDPSPEVDLTWLYAALAVAIVLVGAASGIATYGFRINRRLEQSLADTRQAEGRLRVLSTAIDQSPTSVFITGPDAVIQYVNPYFTEETGYSSAEVIGKTPKILQSGLTPNSTYREMWDRLKCGESWTGELVNRRKSGEIYWEEAHIAPVKDHDGKTTHYVAVKLDITERRRTHERLAYMAHHDVLTNLPNRALFFERLEQGLALAKRSREKLALIFIDLDKFKSINDTSGHLVGDQVLLEAANRMSSCVRDSDTVGRIGGDEFVVLLLNIDSQGSAIAVAEKIRDALSQPFTMANKTFFISSSVGIAIYPEHGGDEIELGKNADSAMYHAKESGGDRVEVFEADSPQKHWHADRYHRPPVQ